MNASAHAQKAAGPEAGAVYFPKLPPGITTLEAAKKHMADQNPCIKVYGQPGINNRAGKKALRALAKQRTGWLTYDSKDELLFMCLGASEADFLEDRIEWSPGISFYYEDLIDNPLVVEKVLQSPAVTIIIDFIDGREAEGIQNHAGKDVTDYVRPYRIHFPGLISFFFTDLSVARGFADDLYFMQRAQKKIHDEQREQRSVFEAKAAQYRALKVKPPVSEQQRRYIVQANALTQQRNYAGAMDRYNKAIEIDPTSYPAAYFNMALLYAQELRFRKAIEYMKKYLLLESDAKDARSAQDKIYEWEVMVQR
jgi:tetratricopeptide (TPR) repeat protein